MEVAAARGFPGQRPRLRVERKFVAPRGTAALSRRRRAVSTWTSREANTVGEGPGKYGKKAAITLSWTQML